jgi:hypothetical protein
LVKGLGRQVPLHAHPPTHHHDMWINPRLPISPTHLTITPTARLQDINYDQLWPAQVINHFGKATCITTKVRALWAGLGAVRFGRRVKVTTL